ncbi:DUF3566 domain-containing protein [Knoellia sp. 3-2P3]|uniref:DUF3566 domain-containing protein n=1 Tax=unclassified Knoellia TaxID=2618719 RepID=UPI0023DB1A41|nr:DUF3566 domain-containing protein [Knoellia sp. 3-2P3]MDF2091286.1 DUF3566 domain-containing protein [Knoellia sp. 3-2P3]
MSTAGPTSTSARPQGPGSRPGQGAQQAAPTRPNPTQPRPGGAPAPSARSRRVKLTVSRIDPWSAMKMSFLISVALGIAGVVMVAVLWMILSGMGVFSEVNRLVGTVLQDSENPFNLMDFLGFGRVLSLSIVIGVIDVILLTALSTLGAFLYNICSSLVGGLQLTLTDD